MAYCHLLFFRYFSSYGCNAYIDCEGLSYLKGWKDDGSYAKGSDGFRRIKALPAING